MTSHLVTVRIDFFLIRFEKKLDFFQYAKSALLMPSKTTWSKPKENRNLEETPQILNQTLHPDNAKRLWCQ